MGHQLQKYTGTRGICSICLCFLSVFLVFLQKWDIEISSKWSCVVSCGHKVNKSSCVKKRSKRWLEKLTWLKCSVIWFCACWSHADLSCSSCPWVRGAPQPGHVGQPSTSTSQVQSQPFASPQMLVDCGRKPEHNPHRHVHNMHGQREQRSD